ncbi:response regulator transcription factor [Heyndrickxia sporothermodurans]
MYRVFLVDDEPFIIEGLKALIPWEDLNLYVVGTAYNGKDALKHLEQSPCDLVITDIKMPEMNGLELIKSLKTKNTTSKFIVLSGFQEFGYVKEGLALGIENYLLKPINENELISTLKNTVEKLNKSSVEEEAYYVLRDNSVWRWLNQDIDSREWHERLELYQLRFEKGNMAVIIIQLEGNEALASGDLFSLRSEIEKQLNSVCILNPEGELNVLLTYDLVDERNQKVDTIKEILTKEEKIIHYFIYIGSTVSTLTELYKSLSSAKKLTPFRLLYSESSVIADGNTCEYNVKAMETNEGIQQLVKLVISKQRSEAIGWVKIKFDEFRQQHTLVSPQGVQSFAIEAMMTIQNNVRQNHQVELADSVKEILSIKSLSELEQLLISYLETTLSHIEQQSEQGSPIIQSVLHYIQEHYHEEQSLKTLSQKFHVNSIYLGQLFQKETGFIFSDYINQIRINRAKELLINTHFKAGEIGKQVGYSDSTYFYKQFKKSIGVTPKEFRTMIRKKVMK